MVPREENEHCRSSTDFIDELLQLKSLQMRRNKKAGILKSLFLRNFFRIGFENLVPPGFASHPEFFEGNRLLLLFFRDQNRKDRCNFSDFYRKFQRYVPLNSVIPNFVAFTVVIEMALSHISYIFSIFSEKTFASRLKKC